AVDIDRERRRVLVGASDPVVLLDGRVGGMVLFRFDYRRASHPDELEMRLGRRWRWGWRRRLETCSLRRLMVRTREGQQKENGSSFHAGLDAAAAPEETELGS